MRKALLKRIKITKTGKFLYRHSGQNHFNAKASRRVQLGHKGTIKFTSAIGKKMRNYLNG